MLKGNLYTLDEIIDQEEGRYAVQVTLNADHEIFMGHFPDQPVLPGVCLLEMLKEIVSEKTVLPYFMAEAGNIKYMQLVDPRLNPVLKFEIVTKSTEAGLAITASSSFADGEINFKFKGLFVVKA